MFRLRFGFIRCVGYRAIAPRVVQADACGPGYRYDALTRLVLESKEDMRRRGAKSPDEWDAVALTFARPVKPSNFNRKLVYPPLGLA